MVAERSWGYGDCFSRQPIRCNVASGYMDGALCNCQQGYSPPGEGETSAVFFVNRTIAFARRSSAKPEASAGHSFSQGEKARMRASQIIPLIFGTRGGRKRLQLQGLSRIHAVEEHDRKILRQD